MKGVGMSDQQSDVTTASQCFRCSEMVKGGDNFCPHCGAAVSGPELCGSCRQPLTPDGAFCGSCGTPVAGRQAAVPLRKNNEGAVTKAVRSWIDTASAAAQPSNIPELAQVEDPATKFPFVHVKWNALGQLLSGTGRAVIQRHSYAQAEAQLGANFTGAGVVAGWPWVFSRVFGFFSVSFVVLFITLLSMGTAGVLLPLVLLIGAAVVPVSLAIFVLECNTPRDISFYRFVQVFTVGAVLSLLFALFLFQFDVLGASPWIGASSAAFIEEPAKLAVVLMLARGLSTRWMLTGLVLGAAVGAGFAVFETAGYMVYTDSGEDLFGTAILRGFSAVGAGHVTWTAIIAGALWAVMRGRKFEARMLVDPLFALPAVAVVGLHFLWNSPLTGFTPEFRWLLQATGAIILLFYIAAGQLQFQRFGSGEDSSAPTPATGLDGSQPEQALPAQD